MKFSLVLCTIGRYSELKIFLDSLSLQSYRNYELIVVDQNAENFIEDLLKLYLGKIDNIKYYKVDFSGLSYARNYGISKISKDCDIVGFPDDDCLYPKNLLSDIVQKFEYNECVDFVTGLILDNVSNVETVGCWLKNNTRININNVWNACSSISMFIKLNLNFEHLRFDQRLGAGSKTSFLSGEDIDYAIQMIRIGMIGMYFTDIIVYHPAVDKFKKDRVVGYAMGMGAVFKKNFHMNLMYLISFFRLLVIRPIGGVFLSLFKCDKIGFKVYWFVLKYRILGFIRYVR